MPDYGIGAAPLFGGGGGFTPNSPTGYQWGGPTNVGSTQYAGGSGMGGQAGMYPYNPGISGPPAPFQAPIYSNSMDQDNWAKIAAAQRGNVSASTPSSGGGFAIPGSNQTVGSAWDPYGAAAAAVQRGAGTTNPWDPYGAGYAASAFPSAASTPSNSGDIRQWGQPGASAADQYSGFGPLGSQPQGALSGPGVGNWPSSVASPNALAYGIYGNESTFGTNPQMWNRNPSTGIGPMGMTPQGAAQYAPNQDIRTWGGNMAAGQQMASGLLQQFGNPTQAAEAYNWGPTNVASGRTPPASVQGYANRALNTAANYGQGLGWQGQVSQALGAAGVPGMTLNSNQIAQGGRY